MAINKLTPKQRQAKTLKQTNDIVFFGAAAGGGKSELLAHLVEELVNKTEKQARFVKGYWG